MPWRRLYYTRRASLLIIFEVSHAFPEAQHGVDKNYNETHGCFYSNYSTYGMPSAIKEWAALMQEEDKMTVRFKKALKANIEH